MPFISNPSQYLPWTIRMRDGRPWRYRSVTGPHPWIAYDKRGRLSGCLLQVFVLHATATTLTRQKCVERELGSPIGESALDQMRAEFRRWYERGPRPGRYDCPKSREVGRLVFGKDDDRPCFRVRESLRPSQVIAIAKREQETERRASDIIRDAIDAYFGL
jgi:hypothetical protein